MCNPQRDHDFYKDTPARYLGYANEIGESLRGFIGTKLVNVSYGISTMYVIADTIDKTRKTFLETRNTPNYIKKTLFVGSDTLIWQMLASVIIPGYTINRICAASDYVLRQGGKFKTNNRQLIVTCVGLAVIPVIIRPIDKFVDLLLDETLRKFKPC